MIAGNIVNNSTNDLTIGGYGTLTGFYTGTIGSIAAQGTITNTLSNLTISGQTLNDTVNVGSNTLTGNNLNLISIVSVTGNYSQTSGYLNEAAGATLIVSGAANISGATISGGPGATNVNYLRGADRRHAGSGRAGFDLYRGHGIGQRPYGPQSVGRYGRRH